MILDMGKKSLQILRSAAAALLIGVIVGAIDAVFGRGLLAITDFRTEHFKYLIPFLPVAGLLIVWLYRSFSELSQKGMTLVLETGQGRRDDIPLLLGTIGVSHNLDHASVRRQCRQRGCGGADRCCCFVPGRAEVSSL